MVDVTYITIHLITFIQLDSLDILNQTLQKKILNIGVSTTHDSMNVVKTYTNCDRTLYLYFNILTTFF